MLDSEEFINNTRLPKKEVKRAQKNKNEKARCYFNNLRGLKSKDFGCKHNLKAFFLNITNCLTDVK